MNLSSNHETAVRHVAIIMDGNGRWALQRRFGRIQGHREGALRVDEIVSKATELGISFLTLYVFSTENWSRPQTEVSLLMKLLVKHLKTMDKKCARNNVRVVAQGTLSRLPAYVRAELRRVEAMTATDNPRMTLTLAVSYGGRQEIIDAAKSFAQSCLKDGVDPETLTPETFRNHLYQKDVPDPDILIRTGGEFRISNFLLWQVAYSEIFVTPKLWPDFYGSDLEEVLLNFRRRERRFGKTSEQLAAPPPLSNLPPSFMGDPLSL